MSTRLRKPTISSQIKAHKKLEPKEFERKGFPTPNMPKKRPVSSILTKETKFKWSVNEEEGYFALGDPEPDDDLYVFNTTLISCEHFHLLGRFLNGQESLRNMHWIVRYTAFDCEISSDPFQLSAERENYRTFIGDKATARVRANSWLFHQFLNQTSLEFTVLCQNGINGIPKMRGISFADLRDLTKPDIKGLRASLDIIPQGDMNISMIEFGGRKPELRVVIELTVMPNFFSLAKNQASISIQLSTSKLSDDGDKEVDNKGEENISAVAAEEEEEVVEVSPHQGENKTLSTIPELIDADEDDSSENVNESGEEEQNCSGDVVEVSPHQPKINSSTDSPKILQENEEVNRRQEISESGDEKNPNSVDVSPRQDRIDTSISIYYSPEEFPEEKDNVPSPIQDQVKESGGDTDSVDELSKNVGAMNISLHQDVQTDIIQSGNYCVSIELEYIWMRSATPLTHDLTLTFFYSPLGIFRHDPIKCKAVRDPSVKVPSESDNRCLVINDGAWNIIIQFTQLPDSLLRDPIIVEVQPYPEELFAGILGTASIPFGSLFFAKEENGKRCISDKVEILRNSKRLGHLHYTLRLEPKLQSIVGLKGNQIPCTEDITIDMGDSIDGAGMSRSGRVVEPAPLLRNTNKIYTHKLNNELANKSVKDEEIKKVKFVEELKDKERACLERITEQFREREESRAEQVTRIIEDYKVKEKYLEAKLRAVEEKELQLLRRERELQIWTKTDYTKLNLKTTVKKTSPHRAAGDNSRDFQGPSGVRKYLRHTQLSEMTTGEIDAEIARLVHERDRMLATGCYLRSDPAVREIDNALTRLASDIMARSTYISPPTTSRRY